MRLHAARNCCCRWEMLCSHQSAHVCAAWMRSTWSVSFHTPPAAAPGSRPKYIVRRIAVRDPRLPARSHDILRLLRLPSDRIPRRALSYLSYLSAVGGGAPLTRVIGNVAAAAPGCHI